jgi:hypothetical protein
MVIVVCPLNSISEENQRYTEGIIFQSGAEDIINYPKLHSANCTSKHQATNLWFKPMVRILKNMWSTLVESGVIADKLAPSYFIEGMLYNVPTDKFGRTYVDTFCNCVNWLWETDRSVLRCANGQYRLLGDSNIKWPSSKCDEFLRAIVNLWKDW